MVFALYVQFPGKIAVKYFEQQLMQLNPDIKVQIETVKPVLFPPGLQARSVRLSFNEIPFAKMEKVDSFLNLTTIFKKRVKSSFEAKIFDGIISGIIDVERKRVGNANIKVQLENLNLKNMDLKNLLWGCEISSIIDGYLKTEFKNGNIINNNGEINFFDMVINIKNELLPVTKYSFSKGELKFSMPEQNIIHIEKYFMKGTQVDIDIEGEIRVAEQFSKSALNIKLRAVLYPLFFMNTGNSLPTEILKNSSYNAIVDLSIKGTIQMPEVTMDKLSGNTVSG